MAEFSRPSGITVSLAGPATLAPAAAPPKRGGAQRAAAAGDASLLLAALVGQDLELIDRVPLTIPAAARPKRRGAAAPASAMTLDVPVGPDEQAVVLLEDEGEYRWVIDGRPLPSAAPKRGRAGVTAPRQLRFSIELKAAPPPPGAAAKRGAVKRNWLTEKLFGMVTAYVFRFAVKVAGKKVVQILERKVEQGLVAITAADPQQWQRLEDDAPLPQALLADRSPRVLLFVHGTFSSTVGSFGALGIVSEGREFLARALAHYDAVIGFDHPTLSIDPLKNASELLARLKRIQWPAPPALDIIAFSRGGLVARSLIEYLLPSARWGATVGRVIFVGCTNAGTQLAEPANWHRFADHYTNLALGTTRALSLIPGAQGVTTIASHVIRGVGALVKALASGAITDNVVPGLAAMEPDGEFVLRINEAQPGQPAPADAQYFAVTSDFEAGKALATRGTPELPPKLLMRIADWGADELYGEPNDLVVHVRSMTAIDEALGNFVKSTLDYGTNGLVYHTNYFTRDKTATQLTDWLALPPAPAAAPPKRRARPRAALPKGGSVGGGGGRMGGGGVGRGVGGRIGGIGGMGGGVRPPGPSGWVPVKKAAPLGRSSQSVGGGKKRSEAPPKRAAPPKPPVKHAAPLKPPVKRAAPSAKRSAPQKRKSGGGATRGKAEVECHFRAEMDNEILVNQTVSVDVTIARHALEVAVSRAGSMTSVEVAADKKLIVQIAERRNFRVEGERRVEIDVPGPNDEASVSFDVTGLVAGAQGELWVQVRQGPVPLVTLKLLPRIVAKKKAGPVARLPVEQELAAIPAPEPPLDELLIEESFVGDKVQYRYYLDMPTLSLRERFESPPIAGRDDYVVKILDSIGNAWAGTAHKPLAAFETQLKALGAKMFSELMPREMQELLWEHRDRIQSVQVMSMEPFIPWELVYLKDPRSKTIGAGGKFLCELGLVRWLYEGYPPSRIQLGAGPGRARYIIPTYKGEMSLPDAAKEEKMIKALFKNARRVPAQAFEVQQLVATPGQFDLLHFAGHAEAAGDEHADARLQLDELGDGTTENALQAITVEQTAHLEQDGRRPIVVLNACETSRMARGLAKIGGFASAFVSRGAGVFVGSHWSVADRPARNFIEAFYSAFAQPKPGKKPVMLKDAVMHARQAARDGGDATWLAYVVYGHPRAVVVAAK
jgi:CHAT domain